MEFAAAALSSITSAVGSVASTVGAGATAIGGATAGGSSLFSSILQGGASIASIMGTLGAANEKSDSLKAQARDVDSDIGLEKVRGVERRDGLKKSLLDALGERDVAAAASGVDLSFGTPAMARSEATADAERALAGDQSTEALRISRLTERQSELVSASKQARRSGLIKAIGTGIGTFASIGKRG